GAESRLAPPACWLPRRGGSGWSSALLPESQSSADGVENLGLQLAVKHGQIELAEPLRVAEDIDLDDLPAHHREGHDREQLSFEHADRPRGAVDEDRAPEKAEAREGLRLTSDLLRTAELDQSTCTSVGSEDHLRVEDSDETVKVTITRSREKSVDNASLDLHVGVRSGVARLNAAACAAGKLASCLGGALDDGRDLLEGHAEDVVEHERDPFRGRKRLEHDQQGKADRVGQERSVLRARSVSGVDDWIGHASLAPPLA